MSLSKKADKNWYSIADNPTSVVHTTETFDPPSPKSQWDDCLKLSNARAVEIHFCSINPQGGNREDGIDMNRFTRNCVIQSCIIGNGGKYAVTIKGGSYNIKIIDCTITGKRGWEGVDIDIGNFADFNYSNTHSITLQNVRRNDGRPVTVRIGHATDVDIIGGDVKVLVISSLLLKGYVWVKHKLQSIFNPKRK